MTSLDTIADRQAQLSATADTLKSKVDRARRATLMLSISGAFAAAVAAALPGEVWFRIPLTVLGAACLAIAALISSRVLDYELVRRHIRARAASEALKREAFLYAAGGGAYGDLATRDQRLLEALDQVDQEIADLVRFEVKAKGPGSCPRQDLGRDQYLKQRVEGQIAFYTSRSDNYARLSRRLHLAEWLLALLAASLTAIAGALGKKVFDFAAITAVVTTVGAALMAHLQAVKYDDLISSYRGTARRLRRLAGQTGASAAATADKAEEIIAAETKGWAEMLSR